jgi:glycosyltransferase involved in cell wall biosynthesis
MKDLAVIIPAYNDTSALVATLDSIDEQDPSFTVVVVDDGSSDPIEIDRSRYPFPIEILRQPVNGGIVKALNAGLEYATSRQFAYLARLDAADLNRPNRFQIQYDHLRANEQLAMVGSNVVFRDEDNNKSLFTTKLPLSASGTKRWIVFRNCFIHPAVMFRAEILDEVGLYDERYPFIEDYVFFSKIVAVARAENIETPLVDCMVRKNGISRGNDRTQLISGLKFKLRNPQPLKPLWYAVLAKRTLYLVTPFALRTHLKCWLGFIRCSTDPDHADIDPAPAAP